MKLRNMHKASFNSGGVVVGSNTMYNKRNALLIFTGFLLITACILIPLLVFTKTKTKSKNNLIDGLTYSSNTNEQKTAVVSKYGKQYRQSLEELRAKPRNTLSKDDIDQIYFTLLYADKTGAFTQAQEMLSMLQSAKESGVNIDNNTQGINETQRKDIELRTTERMNQFLKKHKEVVHE